MKTLAVTFYSYDKIQKRYVRLAVVESEGLINALGKSLADIYKFDFLFYKTGRGPKYASVSKDILRWDGFFQTDISRVSDFRLKMYMRGVEMGLNDGPYTDDEIRDEIFRRRTIDKN